MTERGSALVVPVPDAEPVVAPWRLRYDRTATLGVPAHITVLAPFGDPDAIDDDLIGGVSEVCEQQPSFAFSLTRIGSFDGTGFEGANVLWLAPEPADPFVALTLALSDRFGIAPWEGVHDVIVPHLTVAHWVDPSIRDDVIAGILPALPIWSRAEAVLLLVEGSDGAWSVRASATLGA